jgi:hypothetical protein
VTKKVYIKSILYYVVTAFVLTFLFVCLLSVTFLPSILSDNQELPVLIFVGIDLYMFTISSGI